MHLEEIIKVFESLEEQPASDESICPVSLYENQKVASGADLSQTYIVIENKTQTKVLYKIKWLMPRGDILNNLTCELICARIGRKLFTQPVCPPFAVADPVPGMWERGFGSKLLLDCKHEKLQDILGKEDVLERVKNIDSSILARVIVFHIWLVADDSEILISEKDNNAFSIEHSLFLHWNHDIMLKEVYVKLLKLVNNSDLELALYELECFDQIRVIEAFTHIPGEWISDIRGVAVLAQKLLLRKAQVRTMLSDMKESK